MTDAPIWPGVAEYLYQAASSALVYSDGTWIVPSELTPRLKQSRVHANGRDIDGHRQ